MDETTSDDGGYEPGGAQETEAARGRGRPRPSGGTETEPRPDDRRPETEPRPPIGPRLDPDAQRPVGRPGRLRHAARRRAVRLPARAGADDRAARGGGGRQEPRQHQRRQARSTVPRRHTDSVACSTSPTPRPVGRAAPAGLRGPAQLRVLRPRRRWAAAAAAVAVAAAQPHPPGRVGLPRPQSVHPTPYGGQSVHPTPFGGQSVHPTPFGGQSVHPTPYGGQSVHPTPFFGQSVHPTPAGGVPTRCAAAVRRRRSAAQSVHPTPYGTQSVHPTPYGAQSVHPTPAMAGRCARVGPPHPLRRPSVHRTPVGPRPSTHAESTPPRGAAAPGRRPPAPTQAKLTGLRSATDGPGTGRRVVVLDTGLATGEAEFPPAMANAPVTAATPTTTSTSPTYRPRRPPARRGRRATARSSPGSIHQVAPGCRGHRPQGAGVGRRHRRGGHRPPPRVARLRRPRRTPS